MALTSENFSYATFLSADFGDSVGSGFRLDYQGQEFLITAKHVVCNEESKIRQDLLVTSRNYIGPSTDSHSISVNLENCKINYFDDADLVLIKLEAGTNYEINQKGNDIITVGLEDIKLYDNIRIASRVLLVGYPTSLIINNSFDVDRPLLRSGIIAGIDTKSNTFIIDSPAFYGNSGGPIIQISESGEYHIVGIVSRYVPFVIEWKNRHEKAFSRQEFYNSGYAICIPLDDIVRHIK